MANTPFTTEGTDIDSLVNFIETTWPDLAGDLTPQRIADWKNELLTGSGRGRDFSALRSDILRYVVGEDKLFDYVKNEFRDRYGLTIETETELASGRVNRIVGELIGGRTFDDLNTSLAKLAGVTDAGGGVDVGKTGTGPAEDQQKEGVGAGGTDPKTQLTILTGQEMKWYFDSSSGKWYVEYGLPDSDQAMVFEAAPDQMDALFGDGMRPLNYTNRTLENITNTATFSGNISKMEGRGQFEDEVRRIKTLALDNGTLPDWADSTPEIMDLVYIAQSQDKSQDWLIEQISKTNAFAERFPNLDKMKTDANLTTTEAIKGFLEYEAGVKNAVKAVGGAEGSVTPEVVGGLINRGQSMQTVTTAVQRWDRMKKYAPAMDAFNAILVQQGKDPITELQDMFDFVSGNASAEVYDLWEASSMAEAAAAAGLADVYSAEDAMNYALQTQGNTSLADAMPAFREAANMLLRLRHQVDVKQFGIEQDDIIDLALGSPLRSGTSPADLQENMNRAVLSAQKQLQGRSQTFKDLGTTKQQSLGSLRETK